MTDDEITALYRVAIEACRAWVKEDDARTDRSAQPWVGEPAGDAARAAVSDLNSALYDHMLEEDEDHRQRRDPIDVGERGSASTIVFPYGHGPTSAEWKDWMGYMNRDSSSYSWSKRDDGVVCLAPVGDASSHECGLCGMVLLNGEINEHPCPVLRWGAEHGAQRVPSGDVA